MPIVIPAGFSQAVFLYDIPAKEGTRPATFTMGINTSANLATATDLGTAWWDLMKPQTADSYNFVGVQLRDATVAYEALVNDLGSASENASSPQVSLLVKKVSGFIGRANRGRFYVPGQSFQGALESAGVLSPADLAARQEIYNDLWDAMDGIDAGPVILHTTEDTPTPVLSFSVEGQLATQRRRLR